VTRRTTNLWFKVWALTLRGLLVAKSYRLNFIGTYFGGVLYVFFYALLARFIGHQPEAIREYGDYFTYLLIGGVFARYLMLGMKNLSREIELEMMVGTVEPLMVTATNPALALLGVSTWLFIEGLIVMALQLCVGVLMFGADLAHADWLAVVVTTILALGALNSWGILSAAFILVFKRADPLNYVIDLATFVLCGVYFPVALLPSGLQIFSYLLPLTYALEALRGALMLGQSLYDLRVPLLALVVFNVVLIPLGLFTFRRALAYTKRTGSLGQY
jgi:ABC-2 type transport system permease protein